MSRTYRNREIRYHSPRNLQSRRLKQHLRQDIEEDLETIKRRQSPLYDWECRRKAKNEPI